MKKKFSLLPASKQDKKALEELQKEVESDPNLDEIVGGAKPPIADVGWIKESVADESKS
ncbi:hypothetical protein GCM10027275_51200 [Rhabdobacter roseus]|uniref:Uncharacterized protein n=1 Tax=Rhabdobacter roseus TaxID=1655419 RepID=A0A840TVB7_9BACT|nr:hypothetical protein [Rhabdobacter roseus]MBB5287194.1 hypothetical protein [Rhabdobacter roseus]